MLSILLLGDSLTQRGYEVGGWVGRLQHEYIRKAQIYNCGLSGYNTKWALQVMPQLSVPPQTFDLIIICFGANDASPPPLPQHVPLILFKQNLRKLCQFFPSKRILLCSPPSLDSQACKENRLTRDFDLTKEYAAAAKMVALEELQIPFVDLFEGFVQCGANDLWTDGLHLSAKGNEMMFRLILDKIRTIWPEIDPEALNQELPLWKVLIPQ